jgi:hypothetical protein
VFQIVIMLTSQDWVGWRNGFSSIGTMARRTIQTFISGFAGGYICCHTGATK